jgi:predicted transcriptional regulator
MQQLTNAEEQVMEHLWNSRKPSWKTCLKPTKTKTCHHNHRYFIKRMIDKQFVLQIWELSRILSFGQKTDYFSKHVNGLISNFFNNSASQFASFFTTETNLSQTELEDLKKIIDSEILKRKNDDFLIKSTITLSCYWQCIIFFGKRKIHVFNRFYLLFSLVFSMVLPFITIESFRK